MYKNKTGVRVKCFLLLVFSIFSLILAAQTPMFTIGIDVPGNDQFLLANKGTQSVRLIDKSGRTVKEWMFDEPVTGQCLSKGTVFVSSSYGRGWLTAIHLETGKVVYKTETGMGARSPIVNSDGSRIYVFNQFKTTVSELDSKSGKVLRQTEVLREPVAGALTPDGKYLFVNNFLPAQRANADVVAAEVSVIDLSKFEVVRNIRLDNGSNALHGICIPADGKYVFVTHNLGRFQVPTSQLQQGWMNTSAVSVINVANLSLEGALLLDEPDRGAAGIWGVACSEDKLFVTHSGTHDVSIVDLKVMLERLEKYPLKSQLSYDLKFMYDIRKRLPLIGNGPRSLSLAGGKLYIPTYFSDTLNVVDLATETISTIAYNPERKESAENTGEKVFNDATYCYQNWQSCNGCHPGEARTDGMNWDLMNDGIGNPKNCKSLLYSHVTPPSMISGIREKAEIAVRRGFTHIQFAEIPEDLAVCVDKYLMSLLPAPSPFLVDGKPTEKAERGRKVFERLNCGYCHSGPCLTDLQMHRIGENIEFETGWDTPTLIEVWRTAPYLFDGRAATLEDVFKVHRHGLDKELSTPELKELVEFINSL